MKFLYSKKSVIVQGLFNVLLIIASNVFCFFAFSSEKAIRTAVGVSVVIIAITIETLPETYKRYVQFNDDHVYFFSFFSRGARLINLKVRYRDVQSITVRGLPSVGLFSVLICFRNTEDKIKLTPFFCNHVELFHTLCVRVKEVNSNTFIDPQLRKYIKRKQAE